MELDKLLNLIGIDKEFIIIGHSEGGLYAVEYAYLYPSKVKGLLLLDPAIPYDNLFKKQLTADEYKNSGVDKTFTKITPPFYYYDFEVLNNTIDSFNKI